MYMYIYIYIYMEYKRTQNQPIRFSPFVGIHACVYIHLDVCALTCVYWLVQFWLSVWSCVTASCLVITHHIQKLQIYLVNTHYV